jgi:serine/threonine protein kinase
MKITLQVGDEIGPYKVTRALGQGGFGAVYEVVHTKLGVNYALKTFTLDDGNADNFRQRFLAEGKVLARLSHPNIVRVFDMDVVADGALAYFVMDLVHYKDGSSYTLADVEVGGADDEHLVRWFGQLASALDYIHDAGIIHRDIKLNNILLNDKSGVMLSDFGISRFAGEKIRSEVDMSRTVVSREGRMVTGNCIMGTEGYMAPEILRGEAATAASDTYALGVTFFRLLTGMWYWYAPGSRAFDLLEPLNGAWSKILPQMLDSDPAKRPTRLAPLAKQLERSLPTVMFKRPGSRGLSRRKIAALAAAVVVAGGLVATMLLLPETLSQTHHDSNAPRSPKPQNSALKTADAQKAAYTSSPASFVLPLSPTVSATFVRCPAKTFKMSNATGAASATNQHEVTLTHDFWIATASLPKAMCPTGGYAAAQAFVTELNSRFADKLPPGTVLRLPTEAEYEAALDANLFSPTYDFEATCETVAAKYAKKYAWKSELDALVYAAHETDPCREASENPAWLCRQHRVKRFLLRPNASNVVLRLVVGRPR